MITVTPVRMEEVGAAPRALVGDLNHLVPDPCVNQLLAVRGREVEVGPPPSRPPLEDIRIVKRIENFFSDLETANTNVRPYRHRKLGSIHVEFDLKGIDESASHAVQRTPPTRVRHTNSVCGAPSDQNRHTVGRTYLQQHTRQIREGRVTFRKCGGKLSALDSVDSVGVDLLQTADGPTSQAQGPNETIRYRSGIGAAVRMACREAMDNSRNTLKRGRSQKSHFRLAIGL